MFNFLEMCHFFFLLTNKILSNSLFSKKEDFEAFLSIMYGKQEAESVIYWTASLKFNALFNFIVVRECYFAKSSR